LERLPFDPFPDHAKPRAQNARLKVFNEVSMNHWKSFLCASVLLMVAACGAGTPPVTPPPPPQAGNNFTLEPFETTLEVASGGEISSFVELKRKAGFDETVQMRFKDLPDGFTQAWTRDSGNGDCSFLLKVDPSVAPGPRKLIVEGLVGPGVTSASHWKGNLSAQLTVGVQRELNFNIIGPSTSANSTFSLTTNPNILEIAQGGAAILDLKVKNLTSNAIVADMSG
jgi:hypothetical protein